MAIEIVDLYEDLAKPTSLNDMGLSPLHLLAEKHSAFKSGTILGRPFGHIAYPFLEVKKKENATTKDELKRECESLIVGLKDRVLSSKLSRYLYLLFPPGRIIHDLSVVWKEKEKNTLSFQIMEKLLQHGPGSVMPVNKDGRKIETPLMIAVKNGVIEMVKKILELYPST